jgi:hypothetical protein
MEKIRRSDCATIILHNEVTFSSIRVVPVCSHSSVWKHQIKTSLAVAALVNLQTPDSISFCRMSKTN